MGEYKGISGVPVLSGIGLGRVGHNNKAVASQSR